MSSLKTDAKGKPRTMMNTTIKTDILIGFKAYCKELGYPMNLVLDCFMEQFMNDEFSLAITNKKLKMELDNQNK